MKIDPQNVTLDIMERHMLLRSLQTQIKIYEKRARTSKVKERADQYEMRAAEATDLLTKIQSL